MFGTLPFVFVRTNENVCYAISRQEIFFWPAAHIIFFFFIQTECNTSA